MTVYRRGDVVVIPFPFTDFSTFKQRPALVISSDSFNTSQEDLILAAITSHIPRKLLASDYLLSMTDNKASGLAKESMIKLGKVVTIDQRLVRKKLGSLPLATLNKITSRFHEITD